MVSERMQEWTREIVAKYSQQPKDQNILVVSHGGAIKFFLQGYIGNTHDNIKEMNTPSNADMFRLIFKNGQLDHVESKTGDKETFSEIRKITNYILK